VRTARALPPDVKFVFENIRCPVCAGFTWDFTRMKPSKFRGEWHHPCCPEVLDVEICTCAHRYGRHVGGGVCMGMAETIEESDCSCACFVLRPNKAIRA
jgi:hypothetical protein